jgi:hypothetical protein
MHRRADDMSVITGTTFMIYFVRVGSIRRGHFPKRRAQLGQRRTARNCGSTAAVMIAGMNESQLSDISPEPPRRGHTVEYSRRAPLYQRTCDPKNEDAAEQ